MFRNMGLAGKLAIGFAIVVLVTLVIGLMGYRAIGSIEEKTTDITETVTGIDACMEMKTPLFP